MRWFDRWLKDSDNGVDRDAAVRIFVMGGGDAHKTAEGRVFVGSGDSNLYALNLTDGRKLWTFKAGGPVDSSPLVLAGRVFAGAVRTLAGTGEGGHGG